MINLILTYILFIGIISGLFYPISSPFRKDIIQKMSEIDKNVKEPDVFHYFSHFIFHPFSALLILVFSPVFILIRFNKDLVQYICSKMKFTDIGNGKYDLVYSIPPIEKIKEEMEEMKNKKEK